MEINTFEKKVLRIIEENNLLDIMKAYTFIYNNRVNKKCISNSCFTFRNIYKKINEILLSELNIILEEKDNYIFKRNIQLLLHKYYKKKNVLDKIYYNFKFCICQKCSKIGSIKNISEKLFQKKFKNIPVEYLQYNKKEIEAHIQDCKNSLLLKHKIIEDHEFFKRNIFCYL
jgi:hypothetical protein